MATNYIQPGDILPFTAPTGGVTGGTPVKIGALLVVPVDDAAEGDTFQGKITGVWTLPKATGEAWTEGALLYWDDTAKKFTTTATANTRAGTAAAAAASADATGSVRLDGVALGGAAP